jgi:hypothetical protein
MFNFLVTVTSTSYAVYEVALHISESFKALDYGCTIKVVPTLAELHALLVSGRYSHAFLFNLHDYLSAPEGFSLPRVISTRIYGFTLEQTPIQGGTSNWAVMRLSQVVYYSRFCDGVVVESECKRAALEKVGIPTITMELPFSPILEKKPHRRKPESNLLYDGVMLGSISERRKETILDLTEHGFVFPPMNLLDKSDMLEDKIKLIYPSSLGLNIHFSEMMYFEKPRILYDYMARGIPVVTELIMWPAPFKHGVDFIMASPLALASEILRMKEKLRTPEGKEELQTMADSAYETFKTHYHYSKTIPEFINKLTALEAL